MKKPDSYVETVFVPENLTPADIGAINRCTSELERLKVIDQLIGDAADDAYEEGWDDHASFTKPLTRS